MPQALTSLYLPYPADLMAAGQQCKTQKTAIPLGSNYGEWTKTIGRFP
jgi:hypothetical protein